MSYQPKVYRKQGGNEWVIALGGRISCEEGGALARVLRTRATIAQINAGLTLLPAVEGMGYRIHDAAMIAVGGNVAAVTTIDIKGTQAASAVVLMAGAQANLTRSTVIRAGATGGTVLADGASFAPNDANTAITVIKAGSDITTATHVDILLTYTLEPA